MNLRIPGVRSVFLQNLLSNYAGMVWLSGLSILTVPLYVWLVGSQEWGLIAACASLQLIFNFLDAGFSQIVPKWFVGGASDGTIARGDVRLFRLIYAGLAAIGFLLIQTLAGYLATHWFQVPSTRTSALEWGIRIVAVQFQFQFMNALNLAIWVGTRQQALMNWRSALFGTVKHVLALSLISILGPHVWVFTTAFALAAGLEWLANWRTIGTRLSDPTSTRMDSDHNLSAVLKQVSVLSVGVLIGTSAAQFDRLLLSSTLPVHEFGIYVIVSTLALAMLQLQMPITRSIFPNVVEDLRNDGRIRRRNLAILVGGTLLTTSIPAILLSLFSQQFLTFWLRSEQMANLGSGALSLILVAVAINAFYGCFYLAMIAAGKNTLVVVFNALSLSVVVMLALLWPYPYSLRFGGVIWVVTSSSQLLLAGGWYISRYLSSTSESREALR